jgi:hypothetical protein
MRYVLRLGAALLLLAATACSSDDNGPERLSLADQAPPPTADFMVVPGGPVYNEQYMDPSDPSDQQQNQGHGLPVGPDDPAYFAQFLRF